MEISYFTIQKDKSINHFKVTVLLLEKIEFIARVILLLYYLLLKLKEEKKIQISTLLKLLLLLQELKSSKKPLVFNGQEMHLVIFQLLCMYLINQDVYLL